MNIYNLKLHCKYAWDCGELNTPWNRTDISWRFQLLKRTDLVVLKKKKIFNTMGIFFFFSFYIPMCFGFRNKENLDANRAMILTWKLICVHSALQSISSGIGRVRATLWSGYEWTSNSTVVINVFILTLCCCLGNRWRRAHEAHSQEIQQTCIYLFQWKVFIPHPPMM